jgi:hypothetical protein
MSVELTEEQYRQKYLKYKAKYAALKKMAEEHNADGGASIFTPLRGIYHIITSKEKAASFKVGDKIKEADDIADMLHKLAYLFKDGDKLAELILRALGVKRFESAVSSAQRLADGNVREELLDKVGLPRGEAIYSSVNAAKLADELNRLNVDSQGNKLTSKLPGVNPNFQFDTMVSIDIPAVVTRWSPIVVTANQPLRISRVQPQRPSSPKQQRSSSPKQQRPSSPRSKAAAVAPPPPAFEVEANKKYFNSLIGLDSVSTDTQ